ncbi:MAG: hypothetical protein MZW92_56970 [Comamonadaceae bacterium]|nr:hypothetical protein [Comamonadaceae bacterium]
MPLGLPAGSSQRHDRRSWARAPNWRSPSRSELARPGRRSPASRLTTNSMRTPRSAMVLLGLARQRGRVHRGRLRALAGRSSPPGAGESAVAGCACHGPACTVEVPPSRRTGSYGLADRLRVPAAAGGRGAPPRRRSAATRGRTAPARAKRLPPRTRVRPSTQERWPLAAAGLHRRRSRLLDRPHAARSSPSSTCCWSTSPRPVFSGDPARLRRRGRRAAGPAVPRADYGSVAELLAAESRPAPSRVDAAVAIVSARRRAIHRYAAAALDAAASTSSATCRPAGRARRRST